MADDRKTQWRPPLFVAAVAVVVLYVLPLGVRFPLLDPDEGLHAEIAREMAQRGDWVTPRFLGRPFLDKPILYFWVQAASLRAFGANEAAVRLPGLLFGLLGAATVGWLAARMFDRQTGWLAGIFYATTILPTALAQAASHDVALIPWINLSLLFLWESQRADRRWRFAGCTFAAGIFLGLSILTKGLTGVAVVGVAWGGFWLVAFLQTVRGPANEWAPYRIHIRSVVPQGVSLLAIAALIAAPWYMAAESQNPGYLRYYFVDRHLLGFATETQPHSNQPWWYYFPILLGGGLPWIGYLRWAGMGARERCGGMGGSERGEKGDEATTGRSFSFSPIPLLWCWLLGWLTLMTAAQSKLITYIWPLFPAVAILAAVAWTRYIRGTLSEAASHSFARNFVGSSWCGPITLPTVLLVAQAVLDMRFCWPIWAAAIAAAALAPTPLIPWRAGRPATAASAAVLSLTAQFAVVLLLIVPAATPQFSARELASHFNRERRLPTRLWMAEERIGSLVFYLDPQLRDHLRPDQLRELYADGLADVRPGDVIALSDTKRARAREYLDLDHLPYERAGHHRLYRVEGDVGRHSPTMP